MRTTITVEDHIMMYEDYLMTVEDHNMMDEEYTMMDYCCKEKKTRRTAPVHQCEGPAESGLGCYETGLHFSYPGEMFRGRPVGP
jgi:hypothetical protein